MEVVMPTPQERAAQLWFELSVLIPIEEGDYDYQALVDSCQALIVRAIVPPIDKTKAWIELLKVMPVVDNPAQLIDALYVYREALLKWQRELIDEKAREAELAIKVLRGYTRSERMG